MGCCKEFCQEEIRPRSFLLDHDRPQLFIQFQLGRQTWYFIWRVFWALYHTGWIIASGIRSDMWAGDDESQYIKWFIYLTNWAYFILTISTIIDAIAVGFVFLRRPDIRQGCLEPMPWYIKADWVIVTTANSISVTVSIAYWAIVYTGYLITSIDIATHVINSVYVILNVCVTGMPTRFLHFHFPAIFGVCYALFSVFYNLAGGRNHNEKPYIYPALDWSEPGTAILYCVIIVVVATPIVHFLLYGLHVLKVFIYNRCECCRRDQDAVDMTDVEMKQPEY